jgi:hypothetical protein
MQNNQTFNRPCSDEYLFSNEISGHSCFEKWRNEK